MFSSLRKFIAFVRGVVSEPNSGAASFGRCAFGLTILVCLALISFLYIYAALTGKPCAPDLEKFAWFLGVMGGVTYGANKVSTAWGPNKVDAEPKS